MFVILLYKFLQVLNSWSKEWYESYEAAQAAGEGAQHEHFSSFSANTRS
jgi:hypothetical protein